MRIPINSSPELGLLIRAARKTRKVRMDEIDGLGPVFVREVERGKETAQIGRVLHLLSALGIGVSVDIPEEAMAELARVRLTGVKPLRRRRGSKPGTEVGPANGETERGAASHDS